MINIQGTTAGICRIKKLIPQIDSVYKTVKGVGLPIKMYIPDYKCDNSQTAILVIHGGGWYAVKKEIDKWNGGWMNYQAQYYADKGYVSAVISYRSIDINEDTTVFDLVEDCKDAITYIREQAEFDNLIIMGDSAGGHLAVMIGMDDGMGVDMVIAANPVLDLTEKTWKYTAKTKEERIIASPALNIKKVNARFLVMHGNKDTVVDYRISRKFCEDMKKHGNQAEFIELDGAKHAFILSGYESSDEQINEYMAIIDKYIDKNCKARNETVGIIQ